MFIYLTIEWTINVLGLFPLNFFDFREISIDIIAFIIRIETFLMVCNLLTIGKNLFWLDFNMMSYYYFYNAKFLTSNLYEVIIKLKNLLEYFKVI